MRRAGWYIPSLPNRLVVSQVEFDGTTIHHHVVMVEPVLDPVLSIDLDALNVEAALSQRRAVFHIVAQDPQGLVAVDGHIDVREPRRA